MTRYEFDFPVLDDSGDPFGIKISNVFRNLIDSLSKENVPQYINEIPFLRGRCTEFYLDDSVAVFVAQYGLQMNMASIGTLKAQSTIDSAILLISKNKFPDYATLRETFSDEKMNFNNFIFASSVSDGKISGLHFQTVLVDWLNDKVLPPILENNKQRVLDAIPIPPQYDTENISKNIFVLEDESEDMKNLGRQGTYFYLKEIGFITCSHVLTPEMRCFDPHNLSKKYPINIIAENTDIDLAILDIPGLIDDISPAGLEKGSADTLEQMDHLAVAGFPNYHLGDLGILSPGLIIGFRPVHGIRRLLINAAIVSGNSGGPVVDGTNKVIGVAVTGADCSEDAQLTENHGVIPIEALNYLLK